MRVATIDNTKAWTVDDYLMLGEMTTPCQLINGELIMSPSPNPYHQTVASNLNDILKAFARKTGGMCFFSPLDLYIDKKNVFQPDLILLSEEGKKYITKRGIEGPPDIVVEVISPSNSYTDRYDKKVAYQKFKVKEYWIVDPANQTLEIYSGESWNKPILYLASDGEVKSTILTTPFDLSEIF